MPLWALNLHCFRKNNKLICSLKNRGEEREPIKVIDTMEGMVVKAQVLLTGRYIGGKNFNYTLLT